MKCLNNQCLNEFEEKSNKKFCCRNCKNAHHNYLKKFDPEYKEYSRNYYRENLESCKKNAKKKYDWYRKNDPVFKFKHDLRITLKNTIIARPTPRKKFINHKYEHIFGISYVDLRSYIQSLFEPWMNWDNNGKYNGEYGKTWQIDHIKQLRYARTIDEVANLFHYTNLRPIDSMTNKLKA